MNNNTELYNALRQKYPRFVYEAFHHEVVPEGLKVWFDFRMGDIEFHPTALVERRPFLDIGADIDTIVFNIGMIELISYWKCVCPPVVEVRCGALTDSQMAFWRKLYWHGLGEFFYTNGIQETQEAFLQVFSVQCSVFSDASQGCANQLTTNHSTLNTDNYLVPIGGGKDSVVTLELLRRAGKQIWPLIMNPRGATVECARMAGFPIDEVLVIRRTIDPTLLELNAKGYLNGHTPFSAMLAFYTQLASVLSGVPNVALSNESSANESTVIGSDVNHQYSKSLEFEDDFRDYSSFLIPHSSFNYFSFLRPLSELQIAMLFSRFTQYHDVFRSCNVGSKQDIWCGHCAKCLFACIILSPFIEPSRLNRIFGKAMLDDLSLEHEFKQLLGEEATKPFECVGTVGEVRQALAMTLSRWYPVEKPALLKLVELDKLVGLVELDKLEAIGNLSAEERKILQAACSEKTN